MKTRPANIRRYKMKPILIACMVLCIVLLCAVIQAGAVAKVSQGEQAFMKSCAVCHANGGNIVNTAKPINKKALEARGIKKPADIVRQMRNSGPGMTRFDEKAIPDKEARAIAEYILKTFK
jgi:cytochrome c6